MAKLKVFFNYCTALAITEVTQITSRTITEFLIFLEEEGHNAGGIHGFYRTLKTFLRWYEEEAERTDWRNPITKIKPPIVPLTPLDAAPIENIRAMIHAGACSDLIDARDKAILYCLLDSGLRVAEFLALSKDDIDLISGAVEVRCGKGRRPRTVFLGDKARQSLRKYLKQRTDYSPALWISKSGERLTETGLRMILRRRAKRAGVPVPCPHSFRRACALERWRRGGDLLTISRLLGHSSLQVLSRYIKQAPADLRQAAKQTSPADLNF